MSEKINQPNHTKNAIFSVLYGGSVIDLHAEIWAVMV